MFTPRGIPHGPGRKSRLSSCRVTLGVDESGHRFSVSDDWTESRTPPTRSRRWTGMTIFYIQGFDDTKYGGDQRRQRDRIGDPISAPPKEVVWADEVDSD